jgi:hypothetical protein
MNRLLPCFGLVAVFALIFSACEAPDTEAGEDLIGTVELRTLNGSPLTNGAMPGDTVKAVVTGSAGAGLNYQWQKGTGANGPFTGIASKNTPIYIVAENDAGAFIRVAVTAASGSGYKGTITSAAVEILIPDEKLTGDVTFAKFPAGDDEVIRIGDIVKASVSGDSNATEFNYQWQKRDGETGDFYGITGRRPSDTYTIIKGDVVGDDYLKVVVTAPGFSGSIESPAVQVKAVTFTVTFEPDGGTLVTPAAVKIEEGTTEYLKLGDDWVYYARLTDYAFIGWYEEGDTEEEVIPILTVTRDITLVAKWVLAVKVKLDTDGGTFENVAVERDYDLAPGSIFRLGFTPVKPDFVFVCWYIKDDPGETPVNLTAGIRVDGHITIMAKWKASFTVTLDLDGGEKNHYSEITSYNIGEGETLDLSKVLTPRKRGFVFGGWLWNGTPVSGEITVNETMTLIAKWFDPDVLGIYENDGEVYYLSEDEQGFLGTIGAFFSSATSTIRVFKWSASIVDNQPATINANSTITVGGKTFIKTTRERKQPESYAGIGGDWINESETVVLRLGNNYLGASLFNEDDSLRINLAYLVEDDIFYLVTLVAYGSAPGEVVWRIRLVNGALPSGWRKL